jgi:predicted ATPase/class 3 adenylate cyclase
MKRHLPTGNVTVLFTDVEGSTKLLGQLGAEAYAAALAEHRRVIREACAAQGGVEVDTQGDAFFFAFPSASGALAAAEQATQAHADGPIQVRIGLHSGTPLVSEEGYIGDDVHLAARVAASGHGGQVLVSSQTAALVRSSGSEPQALSLIDLGEHRLKDIAGPVAIYQLGEGRFPPLKTISNTNLPRPASSFVGREAELSEVLSRLEAGARLLTLTGPGGSGKTRLAIEAAASLVPEYKAGVFWVGLAPLRDPALVPETIAQTLGAKDGLAEHISERELLLLLDNLEQVIESAPELSSLLSVCPNLTLLVTSRELLRVQGEVEYPVPPLAEPEAVSLFCERAQTEPSEDIRELCARLDNLPLAVELAAARTKALSPAQILERLSDRLDLLKGGRDADPRQQTLRATIEWSYDLLSDEEQQLFRRLSVFAGGCTLEAAEEVAEADLDTLQSLVEKSLLRFTASEVGSRYWMLETIREYAGERLKRSGEADRVRDVHSRYFLERAERRSGSIDGAEQAETLSVIAADHDEYRAALAFLQASGDHERLAQLAVSLRRFWELRGHLREGFAWLEAAASAADPLKSLQPWALQGAAILASRLGEIKRATELSQRRTPTGKPSVTWKAACARSTRWVSVP